MGIHILPGHYIQRRQGRVSDYTRGRFELVLQTLEDLTSGPREQVILSAGPARLVYSADRTLVVIHENGELRSTEPCDFTNRHQLTFAWDTKREIPSTRVTLEFDGEGLILVPTVGIGWPVQMGALGEFNISGGLINLGARPGYTLDAFYGTFSRVFFKDGDTPLELGKNTYELLFRTQARLLQDELGDNHWAVAAGMPPWMSEG